MKNSVRMLSSSLLQALTVAVLLSTSIIAQAMTPADLPSWLSVDKSFEVLKPISIAGLTPNVFEFEISLSDPKNKLGYLYFGQLNEDQTVTWMNGTPGSASGAIVEVKDQVVTLKDSTIPFQFSINPAQEIVDGQNGVVSEIKVLFKKPNLKVSTEKAPQSIKSANKALFPIVIQFSGEFFLPGSKVTAPALMLEIDETATFQQDGQVAKAGSVDENGKFVTSKGSAKWSPDKNGNIMITRMWGDAAEVIVLDLKSRRSYVQGNKREISAFEAYTTTKGGMLYLRPASRSESCSVRFKN